MSVPKIKKEVAPDKDTLSPPEKFLNRIEKFKSNELIIGLAFPLGTTTTGISDSIRNYFKLQDYSIKEFKVSQLILETMDNLVPAEKRRMFLESIDRKPEDLLFDKYNEFQRINNLQLAGNFIREQYEPATLAQLAIRKIASDRMERARPQYEEYTTSNPDENIALSQFSVSSKYIPDKTVYILNSLKNPAEAEILKAVYGDIFYLIGAIQSRNERVANLKGRIILPNKTPDEIKILAEELEERDRKQSDDHEQQLDKTLNACDFFLSVKKGQDPAYVDKEIKRFLDLVHGVGVFTPTKDEYGMYIAYSAGLGSACMSRQVGASISDEKGNIISTGCNDVPKFKGGLYIASDEDDQRCFKDGAFCRNDNEKRRIKSNIEAALGASSVLYDELVDKIFKDARIKDLIEFSRAVHAEMEAIVSLSRRGDGACQGATLYTTTFPCHNCARHIVAAGIGRVIFIEPYDKSLALELHEDSITRDGEANKLPFDHFTGVSPVKYADLFKATDARKDSDGKFTGFSRKSSERSMTYLESYRDLEQRTNIHLNESGLSLDH
ncbi:deoxycytidylate deaminase [Marinobacter sp. NP-4(2019)]|uniref:anti-phage dCTP deaminase n=1 Tax=Marinobacter sp. NP-4(2019) TaxID=2488665 RepID=UPI000FC3F493|nr:anti-phage dCTP deaminase [Marinobacter sp. NP-4(2019)]AZT84913.1 deoxycytidylate deaminase [Marinobacter sp. NP-4(2019)]